MVVFINKTLLVDGKASDVHFQDPSCVGILVRNGEVIQLVAGRDTCGTVVQVGGSSIEDHDGDVMATHQIPPSCQSLKCKCKIAE